MEWYCIKWHGMASAGIRWFGCHRIAWDGMVLHRMALDGIEWHGMALDSMGWHRMAWDCMDGIGWHGMAWNGMGWHKKAWDGIISHWMASDNVGMREWHGWLGMAWMPLYQLYYIPSHQMAWDSITGINKDYKKHLTPGKTQEIPGFTHATFVTAYDQYQPTSL